MMDKLDELTPPYDNEVEKLRAENERLTEKNREMKNILTEMLGPDIFNWDEMRRRFAKLEGE